MRILGFWLSLALSANVAMADQTAPLGLRAPAVLQDSGFLAHLLPRFTLKTGVRVQLDREGAMVLSPQPPGTAVIEGDGITYHLQVPDDPRAKRFADWMRSEIGRRTIEQYHSDGRPLFRAAGTAPATVADVVHDGDIEAGAVLSLKLCGRCHVIGAQNRLGGIDSTPSFAVLRSLPDWDQRFQQFYVLKPHGAFTQVDGVTPPFDPERPPPLVPIEMTLADLEAILAFVGAGEAADLGSPLHLQ